VFFFIFSTGILPWRALTEFWPFFPLIAGIGFLALAGTGERTTSSLVLGIAAVLVAVLGFWTVQGRGGDRVLAPLIRLWPAVIILAGALVFHRARRERLELEDAGRAAATQDESSELRG
jgi:hypothetical protein